MTLLKSTRFSCRYNVVLLGDGASSSCRWCLPHQTRPRIRHRQTSIKRIVILFLLHDTTMSSRSIQSLHRANSGSSPRNTNTNGQPSGTSARHRYGPSQLLPPHSSNQKAPANKNTLKHESVSEQPQMKTASTIRSTTRAMK